MTNSADRTTWFLAQFKPNSHQIALRNLKRQGFETFLPMHEETSRAGGRFVARLRPLFPGYLFVAFDMTRGQWRAVNSTYGLSRLVCFGNRPQPVPCALVEELSRRCDETGRLRPQTAFRPGDRVAVAGGPFAQFAARIERIATDRRVWILLEFMGGETRLDLPSEQLRAV